MDVATVSSHTLRAEKPERLGPFFQIEVLNAGRTSALVSHVLLGLEKTYNHED